jgi:acyl-CoA reductase-like NAD-dependent aldehyde dehydrogenase
VGVIAPWNFPLGMVFEPLAGVLAAGNRAMIKPSEFTPATSALIEEMMTSAFDAREISVVTGGPEVGQAFSALPFDHMIFTGRHECGAPHYGGCLTQSRPCHPRAGRQVTGRDFGDRQPA